MPRVLPSILHIDDCPDEHAILSHHMRGFANVISCVSSSEALEKVKDEGFEYVVVDVHLPQENGYEIAAKIKQELPEAYIIITSGVFPDVVDIVGEESFLVVTKDKLSKRLISLIKGTHHVRRSNR